MGYLTPILFRNDSGDMIRDNPEQVAQAIYHAMGNTTKERSYSITHLRKRKWYEFWKPKFRATGVDCNPIEALPTRHADQISVVLIHGNTWIDLSGYLYNLPEEGRELEYLKESINIAQRELTLLKKKIKQGRD